jgi:hypothetical protein
MSANPSIRSVTGEVLIANRLTRFGLRQVHVMRAGGQVEREHWLQRIPPTALEQARAVEYAEESLGVWHLVLIWGAREMVQLSEPLASQIGPVALWRLAPGERLSAAIEAAAYLYLAEGDGQPDTAWAPRLPAGAPNHLQLGEGFELKIEVAPWVPPACVAVGNRANKTDGRDDGTND